MKTALLIVTLKYTILLPRMFDVFNTIFSNKILEREREIKRERIKKLLSFAKALLLRHLHSFYLLINQVECNNIVNVDINNLLLNYLQQIRENCVAISTSSRNFVYSLISTAETLVHFISHYRIFRLSRYYFL